MRPLYFLNFALFFATKNECNAKKMCVRKMHTIRSASFFQRIELPSPIRCIEGCIDNIEHCKAALFIFDKNKNKGFCQLYATNSNSSDIEIALDGTLNPMNTVYEVLDRCPMENGLISSGDEVLGKIKPELRKKLELWSDPEPSEAAIAAASQNEARQNSKNDESVGRGMSPRGEGLEEGQNLEKASFDENRYDRLQGWADARQEMSDQISRKFDYGSGLTSAATAEGGAYSQPHSSSLLRPTPYDTNINKLPPSTRQHQHHLSFPLRTFNVNNNYLPKQDGYASSLSSSEITSLFQRYRNSNTPIDFSLPTNGVAVSGPIQPVSVTHGRRGGGAIPYAAACRGANCYTPALAYLRQQQRDYSQPCLTYASSPCSPRRPNPCIDHPQTCAPPTAVHPHIPMPASLFSYGGGASDGGNAEEQQQPQTASEPGHLNGPTAQYRENQSASNGRLPPSDRMTIAATSWSEWSPATPCSVTCGIGTRKRKRFCSIDGQCAGESTKEEQCNAGPCPQWTAWTAWSVCSRRCGGGEQSRSRACSTGRGCQGPSKSVRACNVENCAQWSTWNRWEPCSVTCGIGQQKRRRHCVGGDTCIGEPYEEKPCEKVPCPSWLAWGPWSKCSASCGQGQKHRNRICDGANNNINCAGEATEQELCATMSCPEWTDWSSWTQCTETCGTKGTRLRTRTCLRDNLLSSLCDGAAQDQMACRDLPECPSWSSWGSWSSCSAICGHGQENRQRSCLPVGTKCTGAEQEFRFCQESVCPYWDEWSKWSGCSVTCGIGSCERRRKCVKGDAANAAHKEGFVSEGYKEDTLSAEDVAGLHRNSLDVDARGLDSDRDLNFTPPTNSVPTSDVISVSQSNSVIRSVRGNANTSCTGPAVERKQCDAGPCCELSEWSPWSSCSVTCGGGSRQRHRTCSLRGGSQSYEVSRPPYYGQEIQEQLAVEPATESEFGFLGVSYDGRAESQGQSVLTPVSAGLQPIAPVNGFLRLRRQTSNVYNVEPYEQNVSDESVCRCDGELNQEQNCAQLLCPQTRTGDSTCGWSPWSEWCGCTGPCNRGSRVRTRYCDNGAPAENDSGTSSVGSYSSNSGAKCQCFGSSIEKGPCIPPDCSVQQGSGASVPGQRPYPTRPDFRILSQHDNQPVRSVARESYVGCTWSTWSMWTGCAGGSRTRTRSCIGISLAKIKCHCDGNLVEQMPCSFFGGANPEIKPVKSNPSSAATLSPAVSPVTWEALPAVPGWRTSAVTVYHDNSSIALCSWSQWGPWTACSVSCGTGEFVRKRSCSCRSCGQDVNMEVHPCTRASCDAAAEANYRKNPFD